MLDFKKLVLEALGSTSSSTLSSFVNFYEDPTQLTDVRDYLKHFGINAWPGSNPIIPLSIAASKRAGVADLVPLAHYFPLIDFIAYVIHETNDINLNKPMDANTADSVGKKFVNSSTSINSIGSSSTTTKDPLFDYTPISITGSTNIGPLRRKINQNSIGALSLKQYDKLSIKQAFYALLEARKKTRKATIDPGKLPTSNKFVDDILKFPENYVGKTQIPAEVSSLYDQVTGRVIIQIAMSMKDFFDSECERLILSKNPNPSDKIEIKTVLDEFITNKIVSKNRLSPTRPTDFEFVYVKRGFEDYAYGPGINNGSTKGYTIENIRKIDSPSAKELIRELEGFANYISQGEPHEWANKIAGVADALQFGAKQMGSGKL